MRRAYGRSGSSVSIASPSHYAAAKAAGARKITVVEPVDSKRKLALHLGASRAVAPGDPVVEQAFTTCFDIVMKQPTVDLAETACMAGGRIVFVGTAFGRLEFNFPRLQRYELTVCGSSIYKGEDIDQALQLLHGRQFDAEAFITTDTTLGRAVAAYVDAGRPDNVKTVIDMQER